MEKDREHKQKLREIHERETALQIARLLEKKREREEKYWETWSKQQKNGA